MEAPIFAFVQQKQERRKRPQSSHPYSKSKNILAQAAGFDNVFDMSNLEMLWFYQFKLLLKLFQ